MDPAPPSSASAGGPPPHLSWPSFLAALAVTLALFFFLNPFFVAGAEVSAVDANVWLSYAPIPLLVLALLALERKLTGSAWILETLKLTLVKFAVTYVVANIWWTYGEAPVRDLPPPRGAAVGAVRDDFAPHAPPDPSALDPARLAVVELRVRDAAGAPLAGVLVHVDGGLERLVFPVPLTPVELAHDGAGFERALVVVQAHRVLRLRSDLDALHTAEARDERGRVLFNLPMVAGAVTDVAFPRGFGRVRLRCTAGGHEGERTTLAVYEHPFVALTDAGGRVRWEGVPVEASGVAAWTPAGAPVRAELALRPGGTARVELALP